MSMLVECIVSGIQKKVFKSGLDKKIAKFGSLEEFQKHFICREAKKLLKNKIPADEVQKKLLPKGRQPFSINYQALARLKLLKKAKGNKKKLSEEELRIQQEQTEKNEREYHEFQERLKTCSKTWVEWATGGPNQCQVSQGGTCIRPDIYYNNEYNRAGRCSPCPYHEHCLCTNKELKKLAAQ